MSGRYPIPAEALDDRLAWVGTAGAGKTYNASAAVEKLLASSARVIIPDPLDVWWGLRLAPDGERASRFKPVIFGGPHGDLPLNERSGALLGETCAKMRESCIISLADLKSKAAERRFMLDFLQALERHTNREPVHLVFDEADLWAPQVLLDRDGEAAKLLGMMEQIVRRGRVKGFIPWLITQRPAVLSKNVLSQADGLMAFKLTSSQDRDAIGAWIEGQADKAAGREILASLPTMQQGQGVVWIPGRGILETAQFPAKTTFDSSRTPKRGEVARATSLKPLDLGALKDRLAAVEEEAKANDPKVLRAEIARLSAELAKAAKAPAAPDPAAIAAAEERGLARGRSELADALRRAAESGAAAFTDAARQFHDAMTSIRTAGPQSAPQGPATPAALPQRPAQAPRPPAPAPRAAAAVSAGELGAKGKVLQSLAWWKAAGFPSIDRRRACIMAGYSPKASTFGVYIGQLSAAGLIHVPEPGRIALTDAGEAEAPAPDFAGGLVDAVRALLSQAEVKVFDQVVAAYPASISRGDLADAVGLSRTASTLGVYVGKVASFGFIESGRGSVRAADWLFPGVQ